MLEYPLTKAHRIRLARAFKEVPRVDISIECVIEGQMGKAWVDDLQAPTVYKIQVGPFCYFAGAAGSKRAATFLEQLEPYTLFMPSSSGWMEAAKQMYADQLIGFERYSFSSEHLAWAHLDQLVEQSRLKSQIRRMDLNFAESIWGQEHFVDLSAFDAPEDFIERGVGYYCEERGATIGAAYSSLVCSQGIEVSLFVMEDYRQKGIGTMVSGQLLKWCLENQADANWDAANPVSCKLAEKLGYERRGSYQAYYLRG